MAFEVKEMSCRSALHYHNSKWLPFKYDINVYRGCAHRCIYCYALYSHEYLGGGNFYSEVFAKTNIVDVLKRELPGFSRETVNLGGVTDSYQPAERDFRLMPGVLALLAQYGVPATLSTKSTLVLRDIDLIKKVDDAAGMRLAFSITTMDKTVAALIEPGSPRPAERMHAVGELKRKGLACGVHMMPVIPYLTSDPKSMEAVFGAAKDAGADYVLAGGLNLKSATSRGFFDSVRQAFPSEYGRVSGLYRDRQAYRAYKKDLAATVERLRIKYRMPCYISLPEKPQATQLSFF